MTGLLISTKIKLIFLLHYFSISLNFKRTTWNNSRAGNGKSMANGIGGSVKQRFDRYVENGNKITCAKDIVDYQ